MSATTLVVDDMHCGACVSKVERALEAAGWIESVLVNPFNRRVYITHADEQDPIALVRLVEELGFSPQLLEHKADEERALAAAEWKRIGTAGICAMQGMMLALALYFGEFWGMTEAMRALLAYASMLLTIPLVGYCAQPFFTGALRSLRRGVSMDVPIALAITVAFAVSVQHTVAGEGALYFDSVGMFVFLLLLARRYDSRLRRELSAEDRLQQLLPDTLWRLDDGAATEIPAAAMAVGDELWIGEGSVVPTDGTLLYATAMLDESSLSGEADWVTRKKGETVYAGTFNRGAAFCMRAERLPEQSRAAEIQSLSARISLDKAPVARLADRLATVFVPTVLFLAAATYGLHRLGWLGSDPDSALSAALAVLIVSCPCALALAIPAATAAALIRARRLGVLLADSSLLELLPKVRQVLLDKTGTLLAPDPVLTDVVVCSRYRADSCYRLAVALQRHSNHPIAHAFRALALDTAVTVRSGETAFEELPTAVQSVSSHAGLGLVGEIETGSGAVVETRLGSAAHCSVKFADRPQTVYLSVNDELVACFTLSYQLRDDAKRATQRLRQDGCSLAVLSGDSEAACRQLSAALDLEAIGELTPEAKQQQLKSRRDAADGSGAVMFVGDGINDSLAFAEADIAVATLETTDFVQANADAVLLSRRLECVPDLFALAHRVRRVMHQNLAWALGYNLIAIPLAMAGWVPPWLAAVGMACSSLIVLGNATRLLRFEPSATGSVT